MSISSSGRRRSAARRSRAATGSAPGGQRTTPRVRARRFTDHAPVELAVALPLQAVMKMIIWPGVAYSRQMFGRVQAAGLERTDCHRRYRPVRHDAEGLLPAPGILRRCVPPHDELTATAKASSCGARPMTARHWLATRSSAVMPTVQPRREAMPTTWSVVCTAADGGCGGSPPCLDALEQLHADDRGLELEQRVEFGHQHAPVVMMSLSCGSPCGHAT